MINNEIQIRQINSKETIPLRLKYLRIGKTEADCQWDKDEDIKSVHLRAYIGNKLIGILSAVPETLAEIPYSNQFRLRGLVVDREYRGREVSVLLYNAMYKRAKDNKIDVFWAFVRPTAYKQAIAQGMEKIGNSFELNELGQHSLFVKIIRSLL